MTATPSSKDRLLPRQDLHRLEGTYPPGGPDGAWALWSRVEETREHATHLRSVITAGTARQASSRWDCLEALQAYADHLAAHQRPLPYQLRDELRLLHLTCASDSTW
ncbi:MAG: hypothetical protein JWR20_507 [Marmoricola sp.]|jgi:hypothetical protein|nr:hypothetical protein [Marmoricola sp.]